LIGKEYTTGDVTILVASVPMLASGSTVTCATARWRMHHFEITGSS